MKRRDWLIQVLVQIVCGLYWFHPLVWLSAVQLRKERERACDDQVLRFGIKASDYAGHLLELVRALHSKREPWPLAVAMAQSSNLESRLVAMLDPNLNRSALPRGRAFLAGLIAACLLLPLAALRAPAQNAGATISGVVYDPSGAAIPAATVTLSNLNTKNRETTSTGDAGEYVFAGIPAGTYELEIRKPGFKLLQRKDVLMNSNAQVRLDATMDIGEISETVEVIGKGRQGLPVSLRSTPQRIRVGGNVQATKLLFQMKPIYPERSQEQGIQGTVLLRAVIAKDGGLMSLGVMNSLADPELAKAAVEAVQQWRYQPTLLNGEPVEVSTTIAVKFRLEQ